MCTVPAATTNPDGTITIIPPTLALPGDIESGWRWCTKCQGLYLFKDKRGICPVRPANSPGMPTMVIGPHSDANSGHYSLYHARASGCVQKGWGRCSKCHGLFFAQDGRKGRCPASSTGHESTGAMYQIHTCDAQGGQPGWRWCSKCEGMFYSLTGTSVCPAGGAHDGSSSGTYFILPSSS